MATAPDVRQQTLAEFLDWERRQPERYERVSGVVRMMTGGTIDHNRITRNLAEALWRRLQDRGCEVFTSDVKVVTPAEDVAYPDVAVACGDIPGKATSLEGPVLIAEVLSESTSARDHGPKRWAYYQIASLRHYVLTDQYEGGVEVASPDPDGTWRSVVLRRLDARLRLEAFGIEIGLDEMFQRVAFGAPRGSAEAAPPK